MTSSVDSYHWSLHLLLFLVFVLLLTVIVVIEATTYVTTFAQTRFLCIPSSKLILD